MPAIAKNIYRAIHSPESSAIRKMFEEGIVLKKLHGETAVFDFTLGNPCLEPPAHVLRAIAEVATDKTPQTHGYMPNAGFAATRAVIAQKIAREQGLPLATTDDINDSSALGSDAVVMTSGAAGALNCVLKAFIDTEGIAGSSDGAKIAGSSDGAGTKTEVIVPAPFFCRICALCTQSRGNAKTGADKK
ncbi:MAG: hypothetical protein Ta2A_05730 [Treponemataceae bacterium]|nr:MAG: hypothetical protein Ta2A_05730 [Treponemataceae bacterium]